MSSITPNPDSSITPSADSSITPSADASITPSANFDQALCLRSIVIVDPRFHPKSLRVQMWKGEDSMLPVVWTELSNADQFADSEKRSQWSQTTKEEKMNRCRELHEMTMSAVSSLLPQNRRPQNRRPPARTGGQTWPDNIVGHISSEPAYDTTRYLKHCLDRAASAASQVASQIYGSPVPYRVNPSVWATDIPTVPPVEDIDEWTEVGVP